MDDTDRATTIDMLIEFQSSAAEMAEEYCAQHRNRIFVPPVAYIDATNIFKNQLSLKKA